MEDPSSSDLLSYAAGRGHRDYPCLSRAHNPTSCVPCIDFSPWLRERVRRGEPDAVGEYLWRVRRADPDVSGSSEQILRKYLDQAYSIMATPLDRHLDRGSIDGYTDLRVALVLLAAHETFSGFIMAGESADFMAAVMVPHSFSLTGIMELVERRNAFVADMARDMEYWACWAPLSPDALRSPIPPHDTSFQAMLSVLAMLLLAPAAPAQEASEYAIKAAYLYKLGDYIEWPANAFPGPASPTRMRASYSFSDAVRNCTSRVARPQASGSTPVASGSSVPVWPMRDSWRARRAAATTSCDVRPGGLSMTITPSSIGDWRSVISDLRFVIRDSWFAIRA